MSRISRRPGSAQLTVVMPLRHYFLGVGGALLILLLVAPWLLPVPISDERPNSAPNFPPIRIHSNRKGPDAVVIDTSKSVIEPMRAAHEDTLAPDPLTAEEGSGHEAFRRPDGRLLQRADASAQKVVNEGQASRKVAEAREQRGPILTHRSRSARLGHVSKPVVDSDVPFQNTFSEFVPGSLGEAGPGERKTRRRMTVFNEGW